MSVGHSASSEAQRQLALAIAHEEAARTLAPLSAAGYHLLADRRWPGSRRAQVDMVVVGPSGVFIVDTKSWAEVSVINDRIYRGQEDATDEILTLADLAYNAEGEFAEVGLAPGEVHPGVVFAGRAGVNHRIGPVQIIGERDAVRHIAKPGRRITPANVDLVLSRALNYFPQIGAPAPVKAVVAEPVLAAPVEEWMTFLHPSQAKLVRRNFNGPARIRGAAGTGKTVVGLHRAAYLARLQPAESLSHHFRAHAARCTSRIASQNGSRCVQSG